MDDVYFRKLEYLQEFQQEVLKLITNHEELLSTMENSFIEKKQIYEKIRNTESAYSKTSSEVKAKRSNIEKEMALIKTQNEYEDLNSELEKVVKIDQESGNKFQMEKWIITELDEQMTQIQFLIEQHRKGLNERRNQTKNLYYGKQ